MQNRDKMVIAILIWSSMSYLSRSQAGDGLLAVMWAAVFSMSLFWWLTFESSKNEGD